MTKDKDRKALKRDFKDALAVSDLTRQGFSQKAGFTTGWLDAFFRGETDSSSVEDAVVAFIREQAPLMRERADALAEQYGAVA